MSIDPVSGKHIVTQFDPQEWWEYDPAKDGWTQLTNLKNNPSNIGASGGQFQVPIPEHGVIMYYRHYHSTREVYLYRHAAGVVTGAASLPAPKTASPTVAVSPNPFRSRATIKVTGVLEGTKTSARIFNARGEMIENLGHRRTWRAAGRAPGVYLIRVEVKGTVFSKKILLIR